MVGVIAPNTKAAKHSKADFPVTVTPHAGCHHGETVCLRQDGSASLLDPNGQELATVDSTQVVPKGIKWEHLPRVSPDQLSVEVKQDEGGGHHLNIRLKLLGGVDEEDSKKVAGSKHKREENGTQGSAPKRLRIVENPADEAHSSSKGAPKPMEEENSKETASQHGPLHKVISDCITSSPTAITISYFTDDELLKMLKEANSLDAYAEIVQVLAKRFGQMNTEKNKYYKAFQEASGVTSNEARKALLSFIQNKMPSFLRSVELSVIPKAFELAGKDKSNVRGYVRATLNPFADLFQDKVLLENRVSQFNEALGDMSAEQNVAFFQSREITVDVCKDIVLGMVDLISAYEGDTSKQQFVVTILELFAKSIIGNVRVDEEDMLEAIQYNPLFLKKLIEVFHRLADIPLKKRLLKFIYVYIALYMEENLRNEDDHKKSIVQQNAALIVELTKNVKEACLVSEGYRALLNCPNIHSQEQASSGTCSTSDN